MRNFKKTAIVAISALLAATMLAACGGNGSTTTTTKAGNGEPAGDTVVTLKVNSAWAENNVNNVDLPKFAELVEEKSDGTLKIEWGGGPEAIPSYQLVESLKNGVVDIAWTAHTYNTSHIAVLEGVKLTDADLMRTNGGFEYIDELYQEQLGGAHYLASVCNGLGYNLYLVDEIDSVDDFEGLTIRATPAYNAFVESLGASPTNMDPGDAYQALERNVIQGYGWPAIGIMDFGWQEVSGYMVFPSFYTVDTCINISGKAWDKLNEDQQQALYDAGAQLEKEARAYYEGAIAEERTKLEAEGMTMVELPDGDAYVQQALDEGWKAVEAKDAEGAAKLKSFTEG